MTKTEIAQAVIGRAMRIWLGNAADPGKGWSIEVIARAIVEQCERCKVQLELALAQGQVESHFGLNPGATRSRRTLNIYNVGNVDSGKDKAFASWEDGIKAYCELLRKEYDWAEGSEISLESMKKHDFCRPRGGRYATAANYTEAVWITGLRIRKQFGLSQPEAGQPCLSETGIPGSGIPKGEE